MNRTKGKEIQTSDKRRIGWRAFAVPKIERIASRVLNFRFCFEKVTLQ